MAKKINPMLAIVGGLFAVLLLFSIISIVLYPGPAVGGHDDSGHEGAQNGDMIFIYYIGTYEDGTVFESNQGEDGRAPLQFILGQRQVITGLENAVYNMTINEKKTVIIAPEDAYPYNTDLVVAYDKAEVVESLGSEPAVGDRINLLTNDGVVLQGTVKEITPTTVVIDFNRTSAGKTLVFDITVVDIVKKETDEQH